MAHGGSLIYDEILNTVVISISDTVVIYCGIVTLENAHTAVNYCSIFITLAIVIKILQQFNATPTFPMVKCLSKLPWYLSSSLWVNVML